MNLDIHIAKLRKNCPYDPVYGLTCCIRKKIKVMYGYISRLINALLLIISGYNEVSTVFVKLHEIR